MLNKLLKNWWSQVKRINGLKVNKHKTKYMCISRTVTDDSNLRVGNLTFEEVCQFIYLGVK